MMSAMICVSKEVDVSVMVGVTEQATTCTAQPHQSKPNSEASTIYGGQLCMRLSS